MANLKLLTNVTHQGIILKKGMVVDDAERELGLIRDNLIDRGLAMLTNDPVTHTSSKVNDAQEAVSVTAPAGSGKTPNTDTDAAVKAAAKARQEQADAATQAQVASQADQEAKTRVVQPPKAPTDDEIAATANSVN